MRQGDEIGDMHYGLAPIQKKYEVADITRWRTGDAPFHPYLQSVMRTVGRPYVNKILIVIESMPDAEGYWVCGWSYDGTSAGIARVRPRELAAS